MTPLTTARRPRAVAPSVCTRPDAGRNQVLVIGTVLALLQLGWGLGYSHSLLGLQMGNEGFKFDAAVRVLTGQVPYRDFYLLEGPGIYYLTAGAFGLFGANVLAGRWLMAAISTLIVVLLYALGRRVMSARAAGWAAVLYVAIGLPSWPMLNNRWLATLLSLAATAAVVPWLLGRPRAWLVLAGALCALAALTHQTAGGCLGLTLALLALAHEAGWAGRLRAVVALLGGALLPAVPALLYFSAVGALPAMLYDTLVSPFTQYVPHQTKLYLPLPYDMSGAFDLGGLIDLVMTLATLAMAPLAVVLTLAALVARRGLVAARRRLLLLYSLASLAMVSVALTRPDRPVVVVAFPLTLLLLVYWLQPLLRLGSARRRRFTGAYVALGATTFAIHSALNFSTVAAFTHPFQPALYAVDTPNGRLYTESAANARGARVMLGFIGERVPPGGAIWVGPDLPMLYFLSGRRNPTAFDMIASSVYTQRDFERLAEALERAHPAAVIWAPETTRYEEVFNLDRDLRAAQLRLVEAVFRRCYRMAAGVPGVVEFLEYDPARCG